MLYDGFRNDYLDRGITPTLNNFRDNGVHAEYIRTMYPSLSKPSIYTISTGVSEQNQPFKSRTDIVLTIVKPPSENLWPSVANATPIWVLNQMYGGISACMMWYDIDRAFRGGQKCNLSQSYNRNWSLRRRADQIIDWLNVTDIKKRPNLVLFYVEELDRITHFFGPLSRNSSLMIRRLDLLTKYIITKLMEINIYHITNIIILSDHGMNGVFDNKVIPPENRTYTPNDYPVVQATDDVNGRYGIVSNPNKMDEYKLDLQDFFRLSRKYNQFTIVRIPHGANQSASVIEFAACPGYIFNLTRWKAQEFTKYSPIYTGLNQPKQIKGPFGAHGYLRQNDAIFMAKGPFLARYKRIGPIELVDLYSAFARLLNIKGDYQMDGNFSRIFPIFPTHKSINWLVIFIHIGGLSVIFMFSFFLVMKILIDSIHT